MAIRDIGVRTVVQNLSGFLSGMDRYGAAIDKAQARTQKFAERAGRAAIALGALAAPIIGIGFLASRTFADFEQSMARVESVTGATAEEMAELEAVARRMGETTVFTARQAAGALAFMAQAGLTAREQIVALPEVLNLAAAGQLELATSADIVTNILAGQNLTVDELANATDVLVKSFTSANTNLIQLGRAFKFAGPVAAAAGVSFEEQAAIMGLLGDAGIQASLAGTSLRGATARLLAPTKANAQIMEELGLRTLDAQGNLRSFADILDDLAEAGTTPAQVIQIFGLRAGPAMVRLLAVGGTALREFTAELEAAGGTAQRVAEIQLDTLRGEVTLAASAAEGASISIGESLAPSVRALSRAVVPVLNQIGRLAERFPVATTVVIGLAIVIGGLALALGAVALVLPGLIALIPILAGAVGFLTASFVALNISLGLVGLIVIAIGAAIVAGIIIWTRYREGVLRVINVIRQLLQVLNPLTAALGLLETFTGIDIPGITAFGSFAHGGTQQATGPAIVGERGPELVSLPAGAQVTPMSRSVVNNVTATYTNPQDPATIRLDLEALNMMAGA